MSIVAGMVGFVLGVITTYVVEYLRGRRGAASKVYTYEEDTGDCRVTVTLSLPENVELDPEVFRSLTGRARAWMKGWTHADRYLARREEAEDE
jgi:hypothetical protein